MKHRIGFDYSAILKERKDKKQLPLIGRLQKSANIEKLRAQIVDLLALHKEASIVERAGMDLASSEHNYHLKNKTGDSFIENYEQFYSHYSIVGFHDLSDEAKEFSRRLDFSASQLSPIARLKGMKNTGYERYHPHYDERNYTKPTEFYKGEVQSLIEGFRCEASRSALVCLRPGQIVSAHFDIGPEYVTRLMVPIFTNPHAIVGVKTLGGFFEYHLPADGGIFFINSGFEHYALNRGNEPRYQIRICLNGQEDLADMVELTPVGFVSDKDFKSHPCAPGGRVRQSQSQDEGRPHV